MNKQELIEKYEHLNHDCFRRVDTSKVLKDLKQLDEPQKVVVPPVVSVWYQINKENLYKNIAYLCANWVKSTTDDSLFNWMSETDNFTQILVNMHQFGYEVEKEKRYCIVVKHTDRNCLKYDNYERKWYFGIKEISSIVIMAHTRKELEDAGFGWVFDCPGLEVEEVE